MEYLDDNAKNFKVLTRSKKKRTFVMLGLWKEESLHYSAQQPRTDIASMNDFYNYVNCFVGIIFQIHLRLPDYWNGHQLALQPVMYNSMYWKRPVILHPDGDYPNLNSDITVRWTGMYRMIEEYGGAKNFQCTPAYMITFAVLMGYKKIQMVACPMTGEEEYKRQLPGLISLMNLLYQKHKGLDIRCPYFELWLSYAPLRVADEETILPYGDWTMASMQYDDHIPSDKRIAGYESTRVPDSPYPFRMQSFKLFQVMNKDQATDSILAKYREYLKRDASYRGPPWLASLIRKDLSFKPGTKLPENTSTQSGIQAGPVAYTDIDTEE